MRPRSEDHTAFLNSLEQDFGAECRQLAADFLQLFALEESRQAELLKRDLLAVLRRGFGDRVNGEIVQAIEQASFMQLAHCLERYDDASMRDDALHD